MDIQNNRTVFLFVIFATIFSSCSVIAGIFKTGIGVGVFLMVIFAVIVGIIVTRPRK